MLSFQLEINLRFNLPPGSLSILKRKTIRKTMTDMNILNFPLSEYLKILQQIIHQNAPGNTNNEKNQ